MRQKVFLAISAAVILGLLLTFGSVQAQTEEPALNDPQFLYRDGENLILVNAVTGAAETLPGITAREQDRFEWSAGGQYIAMKRHYPTIHSLSCLNIYNVDEQKILYDAPIAYDVDSVGFSHDGVYVTYSSTPSIHGDYTNEQLWLHSFADDSRTFIYETSTGDEVDLAGINRIEWSPKDQYMKFVPYTYARGGPNNLLYLLNAKTLTVYPVAAPVDKYYASYDPIWSQNEAWFLLNLKEHWVTSSGIPYTNDLGDVYLVRSDTGEIHRLTYTPTQREWPAYWAENGEIAYTIGSVKKLV